MYRKMGSLIVVAVLALVFASSAAAASFEAHEPFDNQAASLTPDTTATPPLTQRALRERLSTGPATRARRIPR